MSTEKVKQLDVEQLRSLFYYDDTSPTCLRHNRDVVRGVGKGYKYKEKGSVAGTLMYYSGRSREPHCVRVQVSGIGLVVVHRIIWLLCVGSIPNGSVIDHIDGNPHNNKIDNLRVIPSEENARNAKKRKDNKTGVCGVSRKQPGYRAGEGGFSATWRDGDGKCRSKYFAISKYGENLAFDLAVEFRNEIIEELKEAGLVYSSRHGL